VFFITIAELDNWWLPRVTRRTVGLPVLKQKVSHDELRLSGYSYFITIYLMSFFIDAVLLLFGSMIFNNRNRCYWFEKQTVKVMHDCDHPGNNTWSSMGLKGVCWLLKFMSIVTYSYLKQKDLWCFIVIV